MRIRMIKRILQLLVIFAFSCSKKENVIPAKPDFSYFPLNVGHFWVYSIEQIHIDQPINIYDTQRYFLKEVIESSYFDETGNRIYRI